MIDRLPPQSLEAEQSVLGALLIDRDAVIEVAEFLRPTDFYRQANSRIYAAVLEVFYSYDGNQSRYAREGDDPDSSNFKYIFGDFNQLGFNATLQCRF